jgi:hypothetical protein
MARYVWKGDGFYHHSTGEPMFIPERKEICAPRVQSDIPEYRSPVDGTVITSRSQRRYDLEKNGCFELDPPKKKRGYRNPEFAGKRGLKLSEEVR